MFFLKYLFKFREKVQIIDDGQEKTFLDHLDDLRGTLVKLAITLVIMTIACFSFAPELLNILRFPVDKVWSQYEQSHLNGEIDSEEWMKAKEVSSASLGLTSEQKKIFFSYFSSLDCDLVQCVALLNAAKMVPEKSKKSFFEQYASSPHVALLANDLSNEHAVLLEPEGPGSIKMMGAFQPGEAFMLSIKLSLYAGIVLSFPILLYFVLQFIVPGLQVKAKKLLYQCLTIGFLLFLIGVCFCYWLVLPKVLEFFFNYSLEMGVSNDWRIGYYLSFSTKLILMFGLAFELPVVVMPFVKLGVLTYDMMKSTRKYAVVAIVVLSAMFTPPDLATMLFLSVPMYCLYEICIFLAWRHQKNLNKNPDAQLQFSE